MGHLSAVNTKGEQSESEQEEEVFWAEHLKSAWDTSFHPRVYQ